MRTLPVLLLGVALLAPGAARGQQGGAATSALSWTRVRGAESCMGPGDVARAVEKKLGRTVFVSAARADLTIEGQVEPRGRGWRATIRATRADGSIVGSRELKSDAADCSSLDDEVVLVIALVIDPDAKLDETPPPAQPPPASPVPAPAPTERTIVVERTIARPWRLDARADAAIVVGLLPAPVGAVHASLAIEHPSLWPVEIEGLLSASTHTTADAAEADASVAWLGLAVCPEPSPRPHRIRFGVCVGAEVGALRTSGQTLVGAEDDDLLLVNLVARARVALRIAGPLRVQVEAGPGVALSRPVLRYSDLDEASLRVEERELFHVSPVFAAVAAGIGLDL